MDEVYMLVSRGFLLGEFSSAAAAQEVAAFMSERHPEERYCIIKDD